VQLLPGGGFDLVDRRLNFRYTAARWQQTANYGFLPNDAMRRTFLAVTIDLPDETTNQTTTHARCERPATSSYLCIAWSPVNTQTTSAVAAIFAFTLFQVLK